MRRQREFSGQREEERRRSGSGRRTHDSPPAMSRDTLRRMQQAAVTTTSGQMTVQEWAAMPEDEPGELRDGLLEDEEVADLTHETAVGWLIVLLRTWASALGGFAFGSEVKYA